MSELSEPRQLFRYLGGDEWQEYRAILKVFAGTFFAEFTDEEVADAVAELKINPDVVYQRLESLRRWGNLTVSSSVGSPSSLEDYYRRHNRYLITRVGQEVFMLVENVLSGVDEHIDVQSGRLRDLNTALKRLADYIETGLDSVPSVDLTDAVRTVFDLHERFTTELTQFFTELNMWQNRYDLDAEEVQFFASVLVGYVSEQLSEIERMGRPISRNLQDIIPHVDDLLPVLRSGLAARVDDAGLSQSVAVRRLAGTKVSDWKHLQEWFVSEQRYKSRLDQMAQQALAAVRTLTANVTRLSRIGLGAASRRADFLRLAAFFNSSATADVSHRIADAAFGMGSCRRLGMLSADVDDPVPTSTSWRDAPRAVVPVSLRERGNTAQRGNVSPIVNRRKERDLLRRRRELEQVNREAVAEKLLSSANSEGFIDGAEIPKDAFVLLLDLISRAKPDPGASDRRGSDHSDHRASDHRDRTAIDIETKVLCTVRRNAGENTTVFCPDGQLTMRNMTVTVQPASRP